MNQQCKVCGEPAAGYHFGAFTCEGCKSFFGRTYNNVHSITSCKNGGKCVINKKNRTACKFCRLQKCIAVGMSKSGSRYGRRSNWFKIHCLLQEQTSQNISVGTGVAQSFVTTYAPNLLAQSQGHQDASNDEAVPMPSQEELALQSHLYSMMRSGDSRSPRAADMYERRRVHRWHSLRRLGATSRPRGRISRENTPSPLDKRQVTATPTLPAVVGNHRDAMRSMTEQEYIQFLQEVQRTETYTGRYTDTSESNSVAGSNDDDRLQDVESRSNSELNTSHPNPVSPTLSEHRSSPREINATLRFTTTYPHTPYTLSQNGLIYPPPGLITPATSQSSLMGGDLLLVSPSPGGLAVEQNEPIDLSVRSTSRSPARSSGEEEHNSTNEEHSDNSSSKEIITATRSTPLDLTAKRPAKVPLSSL